MTATQQELEALLPVLANPLGVKYQLQYTDSAADAWTVKSYMIPGRMPRITQDASASKLRLFLPPNQACIETCIEIEII